MKAIKQLSCPKNAFEYFRVSYTKVVMIVTILSNDKSGKVV